jgi:phosphatidylserine decarboxylase
VSGDVLIQVGFKGINDIVTLPQGIKHTHALLVSSEDESDDLYFNNFLALPDPDVESVETAVSPTTSLSLVSPVASLSLSREEALKERYHHDHEGMLLVEVSRAHRLRYRQGMLRSSFNCDPFVLVSYEKKTYKTQIVRHSLDPVWNQVVPLHLTRKDLQKNWNIGWFVYDYEHFVRNGLVASSETSIGTSRLTRRNFN